MTDFQKFVALFPVKVVRLIKKSPGHPLSLVSSQDANCKSAGDYIVTHEALCVQLMQESKSYKEVGSVLSMTPATVKTHLTRVKARMGLTLQELSLQTFHANPIHRKNLS